MKTLFTAAVLALLPCALLAETVPQRTGLPTGEADPLDVIVARRTAMTAINRMNDDLHDIIDDVVEWDARAAKAKLDLISTLMLTMPALFPEGSYIYSPELEAEEPALVTKAKPALWQNWDSFYAQSMDAAEIAFRGAGALDKEELTHWTLELETRCISCHEAFRDDADYISADDLGLFAPESTAP